MKIEILGAESLGVRGLCCLVETKNRKIVIDPGIALGWSRYGFLPHPFQVAVGAEIREKIIKALDEATDIILSHFHGDHIPLLNPNPYQLGMDRVLNSFKKSKLWVKGTEGLSSLKKQLRETLSEALSKEFPDFEGKKEGPLTFSFPVAHGQANIKESTVMMTRIEEDKEVFVHASDTQLLNKEVVYQILDWGTTIVLASGPPLYRSLSLEQKDIALSNSLALSQKIDTLILDHHLLRSEEGIEWLDKLAKNAKNKVICAANYMEREPLFLEAWRRELYKALPVPKNWHENYARGKVNSKNFRIRGWEMLIRERKIKPCKWYYVCPIKKFTDFGKLERYWVENYCLIDNKNCVRYQMEEKGKYHPDFMLPNGEIRENLK